MHNKNIQKLITQLALPAEYTNYVSLYLEPIANAIDKQIYQGSIPVIGINGSQGSGKSTAALFLQALLESKAAHHIAVLSIDDFYRTKAERNHLAQMIHPLFVTRGVPGTHDVELALNTITALKQAQPGEAVYLPRFDKACDDRKPPSQWDVAYGPVSAVILEGWSIGAPPLDQGSLDDPINALERNEDQNGLWRKAYSRFLVSEYQALFESIDWLLMLKAPCFEVVLGWRLLQENKLAQAVAGIGSGLLNEVQCKRFIEHYQRLTEHCLLTIPAFADAVIGLDDQHRMIDLRLKADNG